MFLSQHFQNVLDHRALSSVKTVNIRLALTFHETVEDIHLLTSMSLSKLSFHYYLIQILSVFKLVAEQIELSPTFKFDTTLL